MWLSVRVCDLLDFIWKMFFLDDFTIKWFGVECALHARLNCIRTDTASMYIFGAGLHYISHIYTLTTPTTRKIFPVVQKCGCVCFSIVVFCSSFAPNWYVFNEIYTNLSIQSRELLAIISSGKIALDSIFSLSLSFLFHPLFVIQNVTFHASYADTTENNFQQYNLHTQNAFAIFCCW